MAVERFPVEAGHVMTFARAVGDPNPIYADTDHAAASELGAVIAAPTFAIASAQFDPDYPLRPTPAEEWYGSGRGPGLTKEGAGQHFIYHRPMRVGDVLSVRTRAGEPWEKSGRSGRLLFTEQITEFRDQDGELVVTMRSVGVQREAAS